MLTASAWKLEKELIFNVFIIRLSWLLKYSSGWSHILPPTCYWNVDKNDFQGLLMVVIQGTAMENEIYITQLKPSSGSVTSCLIKANLFLYPWPKSLVA